MNRIIDELKDYFLKLHHADYGHFIAVCEKLTHDQIWREPPGGVSIANILCHVAEMEAFWIDCGLCGEYFKRDREIEFNRREDLTPDRIRERLMERLHRTAGLVGKLSEDQWLKPRDFHGERHTGLTILLWHARHLGLHHGHVQAHHRWILGLPPGPALTKDASCAIKPQ